MTNHELAYSIYEKDGQDCLNAMGGVTVNHVR